MPYSTVRVVAVLAFFIGNLFVALSAGSGATIVTLDESNWSQVPGGKEVDAIYGDFCLRNDKVVAVVASVLPERRINLHFRNGQGDLIDFATLGSNTDLLTTFSPHAYAGEGAQADRAEIVSGTGPEVALRLTRKARPGEVVEVSTVYSLRDGDSFVKVVTRRTNTGSKPAKVKLSDRFIEEKPAVSSPAGRASLALAFDRYFGMAYGVACPDGLSVPQSSATSTGGSTAIDYPSLATAGAGSRLLGAGETVENTRYVIAAEDLAGVQRIAATLKTAAGEQVPALASASVPLTVKDPDGKPVEGALVLAYPQAKEPAVSGKRSRFPASSARTDSAGAATLRLPPGNFEISVEQGGRNPVALAASVPDLSSPVRPLDVQIGARSAIEFDVVDDAGKSSPVKVQFIPSGSTPMPDLGPDQRANGCRNLYFSVKGRFTVPLPPGDYYVLLSRGPEYNTAWRDVSLSPGKTQKVEARLRRVIDSTGWISADFHNHSTVSGDNGTETQSRIACLIAEGVEFAPSTEHNRVASYKSLLKSMGAEALLATSDGIELTSTPLPLSHHNAFPLHEHLHAQSGGGPDDDHNPLTQIQRLRAEDGNSEKYVQQNHPDIGWLVFDRDGDGKPDQGYGTLDYTDGIEVWTTTILRSKPTITHKGNKLNDRMFNWLQLLNQGHRLTGVANTDAHYCFHDSGVIRNYVQSSTDDLSQVKEMDVVRQTKAGHVVMTNGPFMRVSADGVGPGGDVRGVAGKAIQLKIQVQCANWLDVNRVQVLVNGRPDPALNFTRADHPEMFGEGVMKFDQTLPVTLNQSAHLIVVATDEHGTTSPVMGPAGEPPMAVGNPIYVTIGEGPFKANGDTLGAPLPVRQSE